MSKNSLPDLYDLWDYNEPAATAVTFRKILPQEQTAVPRAQKWRGSLLNNVGWVYHDRDEFQQALEIFKQALAWHQQHMSDGCVSFT